MVPGRGESCSNGMRKIVSLPNCPGCTCCEIPPIGAVDSLQTLPRCVNEGGLHRYAENRIDERKRLKWKLAFGESSRFLIALLINTFFQDKSRIKYHQ